MGPQVNYALMGFGFFTRNLLRGGRFFKRGFVVFTGETPFDPQ